MIKPNQLKKGDKVAIVSLSWGGLGDKELIHKYYRGFWHNGGSPAP